MVAAISFAIGQPCALGTLRQLTACDSCELARLPLAGLRCALPSRRAPALPAVDGSFWLPRFVELAVRFIETEPTAPLLAAIHHSFDALDGLLDSEFLHTWIAAEALAKWGIQNKRVRDGATRRIADHGAWVAWVKSHESEIRALAVPGMEGRLVDRVLGAETNAPTPVESALIGEGIPWTAELNDIALARNGVTHEGAMPGSSTRDWSGDIKKVGVALNVLTTIVAKLIGYKGPISDRSTRRLPITRAQAPSWWTTVDDYDLVTYFDEAGADANT